MQKRDAVIFDMDGTLCNVSSIEHFVSGEEKDFHAFHMGSASCPPNLHVVEAARRVHARGDAVLIVTARMRRYERVTSMWLALHDVPSTALYMRPDEDYRKDYLVKRDILRRIRSRYNPVHAWDDRPQVVELWESEGIPCTVVPRWEAEGELPS